MLSESTASQLLEPFGLKLNSGQLSQALSYLDLLLRWNQKINLTGIKDEYECMARHFGESFFICRFVELQGKLLDIGSGAGFPGLALKIVFPALSVTLLEPVAKKRAFLREVARVCGMRDVEVRSERLEEFSKQAATDWFDSASSRAVGRLQKLLPQAAKCLRPGGRLYLWISRQQAQQLAERVVAPNITCEKFIPIPLSEQGGIWCGEKLGS